MSISLSYLAWIFIFPFVKFTVIMCLEAVVYDVPCGEIKLFNRFP